MSEQNDCILLKVSDIFDELSQENKRLNYELFFANKCLNVLNKLKTHLNQIHEKYETNIDSEDKQEFNELTQEFNTTLVSYDPNFEIIDYITDFNEVLKEKTQTKTDYNEDNVKKKTRRVSEQLSVKERQITTSNKNSLKLKVVSENQNKDLRQLVMTREEREQCFDPNSNSYICSKPNCDKSFAKNYSLYSHLWSCHRKPDICCNYLNCQLKFRTVEQLKQHMKKHLGIKPFACLHPNCGYRSTTKQNLMFHSFSHSNAKTFKCSFSDCDKSYKTQNSLNHHLLSHKKKQKSKTIDLSEFVSIIPHLKEEIVENCGQSVEQNQSFEQKEDKSEVNVKNSPKNVIKVKRKRMLCKEISDYPKADKNFNELTLSFDEREKCFDVITNTYKCPKPNCFKSFHNNKRLYSHLWRCHRNADIECSIPDCKSIFHTRQQMKEHMKRHLDIKPFVCDFENCDYRCRTKQNLMNHKKVHSDEKPFVCPECQRSFKREPQFKNHLSTHNTVLTFKCTFDGCEQWFRTFHQLYLHKKKHKGIVKAQPKIPCDWPGCDFVGRIQVHKLLHTGEKPFVCDWPQCGKRFRLKPALKDHQNIHNNVKPYACHWPGCSYRCSHNANLAKHAKNTHSLTN